MRWLVGWLSTVLLVGCAQQTPMVTADDLTLTIAHINDHHSHLLPTSGRELTLAEQVFEVESGGFARVVSKIREIRAQNPNTLALHAGDAVTGTLFYTLFEGEADARLMNEVCFDAFELGNHEFDNGDAGLAKFLTYLSQSDCNTAVLAANVEPEVGVSPLTDKTRWDSFKPYAVFQLGEHKVGLIGLDIAVKTKNSSQPDASTMFADERETAAYYIAELQSLGIEKIGLLTHIQYANDQRLAAQLPAVDFIIGGDSHTLLGDFTDLGLPVEGPYPTAVSNADGDLVCIAHAWEYAQVVGELKITFAGDQVARCGGTPHLLVAEDTPTELLAIPGVSAVAEDDIARAMIADYQQDLDVMTEQVIATVPERLCLERMGPSTIAGCGLGRQSDAHSVVAQAFLASAPQADFALQNGGGVRAEIRAGDFSIADAYRLLPFANTLVEVAITGAEVEQVLNQAVTYALSSNGSDGAFPHGAGIRFDVDLNALPAQRIHNIQVNLKGQWQPLVAQQRYVMITNSFLAGGNDGWTMLAEIAAQERVTDTYVNYAQSFVDWVRQQGSIERPEQHSTQVFIGLHAE